MRVQSSLVSLLFPLYANAHGGNTGRHNIKHAVFFGDSFTDQSRAHSIANGTYPGRYYKTIYPPQDGSAEGRVSWPWYFGLYTGIPYENYAVGGAVCDSELVPGVAKNSTAVSGGQLKWFAEDHVIANATHGYPMMLDIQGSETLAMIFVGTNDLGIHSLLETRAIENKLFYPNIPPYTPQIPPVEPGNDNATTILDLVDCQLGTVQKLYDYGVRNFLVLSLAPLHLTRLYAPIDNGTIYWSYTHDGAAWNRQMFQYVNAMNALLKAGIGDIQRNLSRKGDGGNIEFFDTYRFFEELYLHPQQYFNGSIPTNVTGHCHQCPNATNWRDCGIGDCTMEERDSYMWWDELHPSEQTGRLLAQEVAKKLSGRSQY